MPLQVPVHFDIKSVQFFQDGNRKVSDVVVTLTEVLASSLADIVQIHKIISFNKESVKMNIECHNWLFRKVLRFKPYE